MQGDSFSYLHQNKLQVAHIFNWERKERKGKGKEKERNRKKGRKKEEGRERKMKQSYKKKRLFFLINLV